MELSEQQIRENCPHCNPNSQAFEFPLLETDKFRIVCDAHPIIEGHLLIIPKQHVSCIAEYPEELYIEFLDLYKKFSNFLQSEYNSFSSFEHGIFGQTVFHSHIQMMPFSGLPSEIVPEGTDKLTGFNKIEELRKVFTKDGGYLFFSIGEHKWVVDKSLAVPRFFRDRFAKALGKPERGNWKEMRKNPRILEISQKDDIATQEKWKMYNKKNE
jgi:diadenosine tetraphosphate (Ap4A) HIT family hydrolase